MNYPTIHRSRLKGIIREAALSAGVNAEAREALVSAFDFRKEVLVGQYGEVDGPCCPAAAAQIVIRPAFVMEFDALMDNLLYDGGHYDLVKVID